MFGLASNRTSAMIKDKAPRGGKVCWHSFGRAYIVPLMCKVYLSYILNFELRITDCAMCSEPRTRAWNVDWHKIHMTDEIVIGVRLGWAGFPASMGDFWPALVCCWVYKDSVLNSGNSKSMNMRSLRPAAQTLPESVGDDDFVFSRWGKRRYKPQRTRSWKGTCHRLSSSKHKIPFYTSQPPKCQPLTCI